MKLKLKTQFWERINIDKVAKIIFYLTIIQIINLIGWYYTQGIGFLTMLNTGVTAILLTMNISYQKHEKEIKQKRKANQQNEK